MFQGLNIQEAIGNVFWYGKRMGAYLTTTGIVDIGNDRELFIVVFNSLLFYGAILFQNVSTIDHRQVVEGPSDVGLEIRKPE